MVDVSVVIPAFNEEERLEPTLRGFEAVLRASRGTWEVVVVDDGSTDGTVALVERCAAEHPGIRCIRSGTNRGKGHAVRVGLAAASGQIRVFADADGATSPDQLPGLLSPIQRGEADVAIGSRYVDGAVVVFPQPWHRRAFSRVGNRVVQAMLLPGVVDAHCGFKAFSAVAVERLVPECAVDGWSFDVEIMALARRSRLRIAEVPVRWVDDARSRARARHVWRTIADVWRIRRRLGRVPE